MFKSFLAYGEGDRLIPTAGVNTVADSDTANPNLDRIDRIDLIILATVNHCVLVSQKTLLKVLAIDAPLLSEAAVVERLYRMRREGYVSAWTIEHGDGSSGSFAFYSVSDRSHTLLRHLEADKQARNLTNRLVRSAADAMRYSAALQFVVNAGYYSTDVSKCEFGAIVCDERYCFSKERSDLIFRAGCIVTGERDLIVDGVRTNSLWERDLSGKLTRIDYTLKKYPHLNRKLKNPTLVLVSEDERHRAEILDVIRGMPVSFPIHVVIDEDVYYGRTDRFIPIEPKSIVDKLLASLVS